MSLVENQLDRKINALRTDRGHEYLSNQFRQLCDEKGIQHQLTIPRTPQQNGDAERRNRTLLEMVRSMMAQANFFFFWISKHLFPKGEATQPKNTRAQGPKKQKNGQNLP